MTVPRREITWSSIYRFCDVCIHEFANTRVDQCWLVFGKHVSISSGIFEFTFLCFSSFQEQVSHLRGMFTAR